MNSGKPFKKTMLRAGMFAPLPKRPPNAPDFSRIPPPEIAVILAIANRANRIASAHRIARDPRDTVVEVNAELVAVDIAITHLARGLKLHEFFNSDDLTFMREYAMIEKFINRGLCSFPVHVALQFAASGEKFNANSIN